MRRGGLCVRGGGGGGAGGGPAGDHRGGAAEAVVAVAVVVAVGVGLPVAPRQSWEDPVEGAAQVDTSLKGGDNVTISPLHIYLVIWLTLHVTGIHLHCAHYSICSKLFNSGCANIKVGKRIFCAQEKVSVFPKLFFKTIKNGNAKNAAFGFCCKKILESVGGGEGVVIGSKSFSPCSFRHPLAVR